jgi:hypothetical protein
VLAQHFQTNHFGQRTEMSMCHQEPSPLPVGFSYSREDFTDLGKRHFLKLEVIFLWSCFLLLDTVIKLLN